MSRYARKVDANHTKIVEALRAVGATVLDCSQHGAPCPDLWVYFKQRWYPLEVKTTHGKRKPKAAPLTKSQEKIHAIVPISVVTSVHEAFAAIGIAVLEDWTA